VRRYGLALTCFERHLTIAVVADVAMQYSHWTAVESLSEWCIRSGVPAISGVDTRAIITYLREQGSSLARITAREAYDADEDEAFVDPEQIHLVREVSTKAPFHVASTGDLHVAVIDCGVKEDILRSLVSRGASVTSSLMTTRCIVLRTTSTACSSVMALGSRRAARIRSIRCGD
jgi:carbamoylphosphate synthase small subunit